MAHTPLMSLMRQLCADHVEAERRGVSPERVRSERSIQRRDVLKGIGAAAGVAVLANPKVSLAAKRKPRIAVIGAGIAGTNAALTLSDAGVESTIYESSSRIGGRMHSNTTTWAEGQVSEWCGELIDTGHTTIQSLVSRFGLALDDLHAAEPKGSTETYFFGGEYYTYAEADRDFQPVLKVLNAQNTAAPFPTLYNSFTQAGRELDHTSVYQWIEKYVPGGHASKFGKLLDVAYNIEYGRDTTEQSSLNLVYLLLGPTNDLVLYGYSDETYHIRGGNQKLPLAIAASLPAGSVKLDHALVRIAKVSDGIELLFDTPTGSLCVVVDRVILTVPFSVLRRLDYSHAGFDALKKTAITQLAYGTNCKLQLQFETRLWDQAKKPWPRSTGTSYADTGYQNTWDVTRAQPGKEGIMVDYTGGTIGRSFEDAGQPYTDGSFAVVQRHADRFLKEIEPVYPGLSEEYTGTAALSVPTLDPNLRGSYSCWLVGQYTLFSGYEGVRQGNVHFAGEHCSTSYQGFMEGGAQEGARAAGEILADYKNGVFP